jgi:vacuolar-type H+-ATPase subunit C/Vma6
MTTTVPYLIAKAKAHVGKSIKQQTVNAILNAKTLSDAETILSSAHFYDDIIKTHRPSVDFLAFEGELRKKFAEMLHRYISAASPQAAAIIRAFNVRIEADNLQILFRAILGGDQDEGLLNYIIPIGKYGIRHYQRIIQASSPQIAAKLILEPELRKAAENALKMSQDVDEQIFYVTSNLEHAAFEYLYNQSTHIKDEIDLLNLETVARAISLDINAKNWIIPRYGVVASNIDRLSRMNNPRDVIASMINKIPFGNQIRSVLNSPDDTLIINLEKQVSLALIKNYKMNFRVFANKKEALLDFFSLKYAEINDISTILLGKANNIPSDKIKNALRYFAN